MQMTEAFASAVAVIVPIFALAAGAEARGIRERLRQPDPQWERQFAAYSAEHELLCRNSGLAQFSSVCIGLAMLTLIVAPVVYLVMPLALTVDLIPKSLKEAVGPKLSDTGPGFVRQVLTELEGAVERASDTRAEKKPAGRRAEPPSNPGQ